MPFKEWFENRWPHNWKSQYPFTPEVAESAFNAGQREVAKELRDSLSSLSSFLSSCGVAPCDTVPFWDQPQWINLVALLDKYDPPEPAPEIPDAVIIGRAIRVLLRDYGNTIGNLVSHKLRRYADELDPPCEPSKSPSSR